jgi:hypothetical protein
VVDVMDGATEGLAASVKADEILVVGYVPGEGRPRWQVVAQVPPLVTVLRAGIEDLPMIATRARLTIARRPNGVTERAGDERALDDLDEGARLYVTAWLQGPAAKPNRPGDGLAWDAPGFEPPGQPRSG